MNEKLSALFNRIKADSNLLTVSEAQTNQGIRIEVIQQELKAKFKEGRHTKDGFSNEARFNSLETLIKYSRI